MVCCTDGLYGCVLLRNRMTQVVFAYTRQPNLHIQSKFLSSISLVQYLQYPHNAEIYMTFSACDKITIINIIHQSLICICHFGVIYYQQPSAVFPCLDSKAFVIRKLSLLLYRKSVIRYQMVTPIYLEQTNNIVDILKRIKTCH